MNILAIGAHPDDIELGCGGLLLKATKQGHNAYMYTLTHGEASGDPQLRIDELKRSSKIIGTKALWIDNLKIPNYLYRTNLLIISSFLLVKQKQM